MNALKTKPVVAAVCCLFLFITPPAWAGPYNIETKLTATDAEARTRLGFSVGIGVNTAIVEAWNHTAAGSEPGSAYLFDVTTGKQFFKLTDDDGSVGDGFGISVAISGNMAIVGADSDDDAGENSGSAYLFDVTTGKQLFKLVASDAAEFDFFGTSVGIGANTAIVGAWFDRDAGNMSGSAYLFDVTTGKQLFKLTAADAAAGDQFGYSVGITGGTAIVGAFDDDDAGAASGSAYVFDVTTGQQLVKLIASDAAARDHFGNSVAISGNTAIIGAFIADHESGSAYLFTSEP